MYARPAAVPVAVWSRSGRAQGSGWQPLKDTICIAQTRNYILAMVHRAPRGRGYSILRKDCGRLWQNSQILFIIFFQEKSIWYG